MIKKIQTSKLRDLVLLSLDELKAVDTVTMNVKKITSFTDYMMISTGTSTRHIQALSDKVLNDLKKNKIHPLGVEGIEQAEWVLIDAGDIVLHLMSNQARDFYDLEGLWDTDL